MVTFRDTQDRPKNGNNLPFPFVPIAKPPYKCDPAVWAG
jgi:hypothetical protein